MVVLKTFFFQYANMQDVKLFTTTTAHLRIAFTSYMSHKAITRFQVTTVALISNVKNNINNGYILKSRQLVFKLIYLTPCQIISYMQF